MLNFLFDLVNHIGGYTEKYYMEHLEKMSHEQLVEKYRTESQVYEGKIN